MNLKFDPKLTAAFFAAAGLALMTLGVALIYLPAGLIALGLALIGCLWVDI